MKDLEFEPEVITLSKEDMEAFLNALDSNDSVVSDKFLNAAEEYKDLITPEITGEAIDTLANIPVKVV